MSLVKDVQNWWHHVVNDTILELTPALQYVQQNGGKIALQLAETILLGATTGTPWATLEASFLDQAKSQGIQLAEGAAGAVLNMAKANISAKAV